MPTVTWQTNYDHIERYDEKASDRQKIIGLRWILDVDADSNYTLDELEEMLKERNAGEN